MNHDELCADERPLRFVYFDGSERLVDPGATCTFVEDDDTWCGRVVFLDIPGMCSEHPGRCCCRIDRSTLWSAFLLMCPPHRDQKVADFDLPWDREGADA